jgi:hypothetical protein
MTAGKNRCRSLLRMALRTRVPCSRRLGLPRPRRACAARGMPRRSKLSKSKKPFPDPTGRCSRPRPGEPRLRVAAGTCRASPLLRRPAAIRRHTVIINNYEFMSSTWERFFSLLRRACAGALAASAFPERGSGTTNHGKIFRNYFPESSARDQHAPRTVRKNIVSSKPTST